MIRRRPSLPLLASLTAAFLYGAMALTANAAGDRLGAGDLAALTELRQGDMAKLVLRNEPLPRLRATVYDRYGNPVTMADYEGRIVLLNFWATWCPPCRKEMPTLDALAGALGKDEFAVVALSTDRGGVERPAAFMEDIGVKDLDFLHDRTGKAGREAGILGLPITLVLDRQGREIGRLIGDADWNSPEAKALLGRLIELTREQRAGPAG